MTKDRIVRIAAGALAATVAEMTCLTVARLLQARADAVAHTGEYADLGYRIAATVLGCALMPLLLWAVMRLLHLRGSIALVGAGSLVWMLLWLPGLTDNGDPAAEGALIAGFAVLGGLLTLVGPGERPSGRSGPRPTA